jgi:hypothetical protein
MFQPQPEKVVTVTEYVTNRIAITERPKPVSLTDIKFYVVTENNFQEFKETFSKENGDAVFYAISVRDYENLSLNMADLRRYILQQKEVIIYYENAIEETSKEPVEENTNEQREQ